MQVVAVEFEAVQCECDWNVRNKRMKHDFSDAIVLGKGFVLYILLIYQCYFLYVKYSKFLIIKTENHFIVNFRTL